MKKISSNRQRAYLIGVILLLISVVPLLALFIGQPVAKDPVPKVQPPQSYLAVPSPLGTQPVLPTLPPLPPVPSTVPSIVASGSPTVVQLTTIPTASSQAQGSTVQLLHRETFGSWSYVAKRVGNEQPSVEVSVDTNSVASLQSFIAVNKQYAEQLAKDGGEAVVRIIFRQALDPDTYRAWAKESGITYFAMVCLPGTDVSGGPPGMLCVYPGSKDPLPEDILAPAVKDLRTAQGVYFIKGKIAANLLPALVSDSQVLIVDLTDNIVQRDLRNAGISDATSVVVSNDMQIPKVIDLFSQKR